MFVSPMNGDTGVLHQGLVGDYAARIPRHVLCSGNDHGSSGNAWRHGELGHIEKIGELGRIALMTHRKVVTCPLKHA